jgi:alkylation response protein AidB-like acyl-CoA dehydrogenase
MDGGNMPFRAPLTEYDLLLNHVVGYEQVAATETFGDATLDTAMAVLTEAGKMCEEVLAPLQRNGDLDPAVLENGVVRTSKGFAEGYKAIKEGGWVSIAADPEHGGMGLPMSVTSCVNDMMGAACLSLQLNPLMTQGQIEALEHHASDALKETYLPKLISGEWSGTMNLTEPHAGSDVGALSSKAEDNGDGTYAVTGQKVYISWGDNDFTENVCHLVLARLPDGGPGTKGISLFLVPKRIPDENGNPGVANNLRVVSLEHKMGLHGSPTCVMSFEGATGWLVGEAHDGMRAMFTMMNNARLGVALQGVGAAEGAYQQALAFAQERKQGRSETGNILGHADVRRMLATMKAETFASRAMSLDLAVAIDMARATGDADWTARAALLTPLAKVYGTEVGIGVSNMGIQVHGGMGFVEETGAAQYLRDVRVTAIYEGTNGIQAMDLVGRKMMDGGDAAHKLIDEIEAFAETARATLPELAEPVWQACETLREALEDMAGRKTAERFGGAVPFLMGFARVLGGHYHLRAAMADSQGAYARVARFYITRLLPEHVGLLAHAREDIADLMAITPEDLGAA